MAKANVSKASKAVVVMDVDLKFAEGVVDQKPVAKRKRKQAEVQVQTRTIASTSKPQPLKPDSSSASGPLQVRPPSRLGSLSPAPDSEPEREERRKVEKRGRRKQRELEKEREWERKTEEELERERIDLEKNAEHVEEYKEEPRAQLGVTGKSKALSLETSSESAEPIDRKPGFKPKRVPNPKPKEPKSEYDLPPSPRSRSASVKPISLLSPEAELPEEAIREMNAEVDELASDLELGMEIGTRGPDESEFAMDVDEKAGSGSGSDYSDADDKEFNGKAKRAELKGKLSKFKYSRDSSTTTNSSAGPSRPRISTAATHTKKSKLVGKTLVQGVLTKAVLNAVQPMPASEEMMKQLRGCVVCGTEWRKGQQMKTKWRHMLDCHVDTTTVYGDQAPLDEMVKAKLRAIGAGLGIGYGGGRGGTAGASSQATLLQNVAGGANLGLGGVNGIMPDADAIQGIGAKGKQKPSRNVKRDLKALMQGEPGVRPMTQRGANEIDGRLHELMQDEDLSGNEDGGNKSMQEDDDLESEDGRNSFAARQTRAVKAKRVQSQGYWDVQLGKDHKRNGPMTSGDENEDVDIISGDEYGPPQKTPPSLTQGFSKSALGSKFKKPGKVLFGHASSDLFTLGSSVDDFDREPAQRSGGPPRVEGADKRSRMEQQKPFRTGRDEMSVRACGPALREVHDSQSGQSEDDSAGEHGAIKADAENECEVELARSRTDRVSSRDLDRGVIGYLSDPSDPGHGHDPYTTPTKSKTHKAPNETPPNLTAMSKLARSIDLVDLTSPGKSEKPPSKRRLSAVSLSESGSTDQHSDRSIKRPFGGRAILASPPDTIEAEREDMGPDLKFDLDWNDDACLVWNPPSPDRIGSGVGQAVADAQAAYPAALSEHDVPDKATADVSAPRTKARGPKKAEQSLGDDAGTVESTTQKISRGMPAYAEWTLTDLQGGVAKYGFKASKLRKTMERQLEECWSLLHPISVAKAKAVRKPKKPVIAPVSLELQDDGSSSDEMPLAEVAAQKATKAKSKARDPKPVVLNDDQLYREFRKIFEEPELYLRVLRYEPLSMDEIISAANQRGITRVGWKLHLRKYLDEQGIAFYSEEQQGPRKRH